MATVLTSRLFTLRELQDLRTAWEATHNRMDLDIDTSYWSMHTYLSEAITEAELHQNPQERR